MDARVDLYIEKHKNFSDLLSAFREVILDTGLDETLKWGMPTYTLNGKNVVGLGAFKAHCGIWFFQGALLNDKDSVLVNAQEGKTQAMRQWRFEKGDQLNKQQLRNYIIEAIENERMGLKVELKRETKPMLISPELEDEVKRNPSLNKAFSSLSPGKQKEYHQYINEAKREATKSSRIKKIIPMILSKVGLNDKYKKC